MRWLKISYIKRLVVRVQALITEWEILQLLGEWRKKAGSQADSFGEPLKALLAAKQAVRRRALEVQDAANEHFEQYREYGSTEVAVTRQGLWTRLHRLVGMG